jgi:hypothetical protein
MRKRMIKMKTNLMCAAVLVLVLSASGYAQNEGTRQGAAASRQENKKTVFGLENNGQTITISHGDTVIIKLPEAGAGYKWFPVNSEKWEVVDERYDPFSDEPPSYGYGTRMHVFQLRLLVNDLVRVEFVEMLPGQMSEIKQRFQISFFPYDFIEPI